jgi:hypothetical protein
LARRGHEIEKNDRLLKENLSSAVHINKRKRKTDCYVYLEDKIHQLDKMSDVFPDGAEA